MAQLKQQLDTKPWYRMWTPFLVFLGPAIVVIASSFTAWLAITNLDDLSDSNYYQTGQAINHSLTEDHLAQQMHLGGVLNLELEIGHVTFMIDNPMHSQLPPTLTLTLKHPTIAKLDQNVVLSRSSEGVYEANIQASNATRWYVTIENQDIWRLSGEWKRTDNTPTVKLSPSKRLDAAE